MWCRLVQVGAVQSCRSWHRSVLKTSGGSQVTNRLYVSTREFRGADAVQFGMKRVQQRIRDASRNKNMNGTAVIFLIMICTSVVLCSTNCA